MPDLDTNLLCPGIRRTVALLRDLGFQTTDSGDGVSNGDMEGALPYPNVAIVCAPDQLVQQCNRLKDILFSQGIHVGPITTLDETQMNPHIEGTFDPSQPKIATILLLGVGDQQLFGST